MHEQAQRRIAVGVDDVAGAQRDEAHPGHEPLEEGGGMGERGEGGVRGGGGERGEGEDWITWQTEGEEMVGEKR